jgi:hypothetical protein
MILAVETNHRDTNGQGASSLDVMRVPLKGNNILFSVCLWMCPASGEHSCYDNEARPSSNNLE